MSEQLASEEIVDVKCVHWQCESKEKYRVRASCTNCGWGGLLQITKGHEFSRWTPCPKCDCTYTLMRALP